MTELDFIPLDTLVTSGPVLARVLGVALTLPLISMNVVPVRVRIGFAVVLAMYAGPLCATRSLPSEPGAATAGWLLTMLVHEFLIGAAMGMAASVLLAAARMAGSILESLCSLSIGSMIDEFHGEGTSLTGTLFWWTTAAVFVSSGGANAMMEGLIESFSRVPPGSAGLERAPVEFLTAALGNSFSFALRAALPAIAALMIAAAILGMVQRTCPQLGGFQVGLGLKMVAGMALASLLLLTTPAIVQLGFDGVWSQLCDWFAAKGAPSA